MERILLYYPTTNIPDGAWVRNSLLYTDKVSSILPYDLGSDHVTDLTKLLSDDGLYHPIYISDVLNSYNPEYKNFEDTFIETIESEAFKKIKTDSLEYYSENTSNYEMFKNKFTSKIIQYLSAKQLLEDRPWGEVAVEKNAAAIYLGMLVDYLARINNENLIIPSTDEQEFEKLTYQIADKKILTHRIQLDNCLPTLSPNATIKDIVKFKNKASPMAKDQLLYTHHLTEKGEIRQIGIKIMGISEDDTPQEVVDRLNALEGDTVEFAEVDGLFAPAATGFAGLEKLLMPGEALD